jgi:S1-C subfamily serine protease
MKYLLSILSSLCIYFSFAQTTYNPKITNKSTEEIGIESITITDKFTEVMLTYYIKGESGSFSISSKMKIEDYYNSNISYPILKFEHNDMDYIYRWSHGLNRCKLIFPKIAPGIETIKIYENVPAEDGPFRFEKVEITNPDYSPKSGFTEASLKLEWQQNQIQPYEGIYESVSSSNGIKYNLALKKFDSRYNLIYLSGARNSTWKEGDIKAILTETATDNLFKSKWYGLNKAIDEDSYIKLENGVFKVIRSNDKEDDIFLKLYPTAKESRQENKSSGTGFAISNAGYIVTNYHVIENAKTIKVLGVQGDFAKRLSAQIIATDKNNDLAILKITDTSFKAFKDIPYLIKSKGSTVGQQIYVLGYPLRASMGDEIKLTDGIISSNSGFQGDITSYQISAPVQPGNSGGPLFDNDGNIIGIVNAKNTAAENASYAIKTSYLFNLIEALEKPIKTPNQNLLLQKKLSDKITSMKKYVYIIEVN